MALRLAAPWNLLTLVALVPVGAALLLVHTRRSRALAELGLPGQRRAAAVAGAALLAGGVALAAVAASEPEIRVRQQTAGRVDAAAYVIVDTSTSMLARTERKAPARIDVARRFAARIARRLPEDVPVGLAEMPQGLLPLVAPTRDRSLYGSVLDRVVTVGRVPSRSPDQLNGITAPSPSQAAAPYVATNMTALRTLMLARFFPRRATHRVAILLTDGESASFDPQALGAALAQARIRLLVVRLGTAKDHLWRPVRGQIVFDPQYVPATASVPAVATLAERAGGGVYTPDQLPKLESRARALLGHGPRVAQLRTLRTIAMAPYLALAGLGLVALAFAGALPGLDLRGAATRVAGARARRVAEPAGR